jgi:serine/threonine protein kinase
VAGRYAVDAVLGRGGYATVYRARRSTDGATVALKVLHGHHQMSPLEVKRFEREAALVSRLRHKNVVAQLDHGRTEEDRPFIVLELLRGRTLQRRIASEGALTSWRLGQVAAQALRGLSAAHAQRVAHRDIKPSNVFLCTGAADAYVRLLDFGIAKALSDEELGATRLTQTGRLVGTPSYMSPEQVRGGPIGLESDLYSLGIVMAEALTGRRLVVAPSPVESLMRHIAPEEHRLPEEVERSPLGPIICCAVRKRAADRYPSAAAMLADVEAVLANQQPSAPPLPVPSPQEEQATVRMERPDEES